MDPAPGSWEGPGHPGSSGTAEMWPRQFPQAAAARRRLRHMLQQPPSLAYIAGLGRLPPSVRPSSLQQHLKRGQLGAAALCTPRLDASGLRLEDPPLTPGGQLAPLEGVPQCHVRLSSVAGLPAVAAGDRKVWLHVARLCLWDGVRFHGSVQAVKPRAVKKARRGETWVFDPAPLLVRCPPELLPRAKLYIEYNVSLELLPDEAARLPARPWAAASQLDELCVAWASLDLQPLLGPGLHTARSVAVPLRGGPLAAHGTLRQCTAAGGGALLPGGADLMLKLKLSAVPPVEDAAAALLPAAAVVSPGVAHVVGLYRQLLAEALSDAGAATGAPAAVPAAVLGDQVLSSFPAMLADDDLGHAFFSLWERQSGLLHAPSAAQLREVFRKCVTMVWAMLGAQAVPPPSAANHCARRSERARAMGEYLQQHPVVALGSAAHGWLHRPLDVAELAFASGQHSQGLTA